MATLAEQRAWLRDQGHDVPARGRLRPDLAQAYADAHPAGIPDMPDDPDWDLNDESLGMADPEDMEPSVPMQPERPPRTARTARADARTSRGHTRTDRWVGRLLGDGKGPDKAKPGAKKKTKPRVSVEKFTSRMYGHAGRILGSIAPATGRCVQAQAAMAGVLLEDVVANTVVDRFMQPAARAEEKLDKVFALFAPPAVVFAIELNQQAVETGARTPQQGMVRQAMLMPVLRESLAIGLEVTEEYADQIKARLEKNAARDAEVDKLIAMIFGQAEATAEDVPEPEMAGAAA